MSYDTLSQSPGRNYYADARDISDGLKYRLSGEDIIKELIADLRGAQRDQYGKIASYDEENRIINDIGAYKIRYLLNSELNKITHLTKYANEERVFRQVRELFKMIAFVITLNCKIWEVRDKDVLQQSLEQTIFNAMLRGNEGFENNNVSKSWNVNENINQSPQQQQGGFLSSLFRRGGSS